MPENVRRLPSVPESEAWVLGSILANPEILDEVSPLVRPSDFVREDLQIVFRSMLELAATETPIDGVTLTRLLKGNPRMTALTDGNPVAVLIELADAAPLLSHAAWHAGQVRNAAIQRGVIAACSAAANEAYETGADAGDVLAKAEARIMAVGEDRCSNSITPIGEVADECMAALEERFGGKKPPQGVPTGFADLDEYLVTLRPGEVTILAARPGMGKTALAANIAANAAMDRQTPTLFVSLEMSKLELADRIISGRAKVPLSMMRDGSITKEQRREIVGVVSEMSQGKMWIDDSPGRNVVEISANARRLKRKHDLGLLIIDYLQLIEADDRKAPREQQVALISKRLKRLARELYIPVLCLAQLNRMNEAQSDKRPRLSHLRESGAIEQDSDVVLFLFREEYYLEPKVVDDRGLKGVAEAIIAKQRNGRTGIVKLLWREDYTQFLNAAKTWEKYGGNEWTPRD